MQNISSAGSEYEGLSLWGTIWTLPFEPYNKVSVPFKPYNKPGLHT